MTDAECEIALLLRLLDAVRVDYAALKRECQDEETMTELRAEIARLRAPPEADLTILIEPSVADRLALAHKRAGGYSEAIEHAFRDGVVAGYVRGHALNAPPEADVMHLAYRAIQPWMGLNDGIAVHDCATAVAKVITEAHAAAIEASARLCDVAAAQARHLQDQQRLRTPSQSVVLYVARLAEHIVAAIELGRSIRGLAPASPQQEVGASPQSEASPQSKEPKGPKEGYYWIPEAAAGRHRK